MRATYHNQSKPLLFTQVKFFSCSIGCHVLLVLILVAGNLFNSRPELELGGESIQAVMVDLTMMAAPEQSLVEDSPEIKGVEESPIVDNKPIEETLPDPIAEPTPVVEETKPEPVIEESKIAISEETKPKPVEQKPEPKPKPPKPVERIKPEKPTRPIQRSSQAQVRQVVDAPDRSAQAVAPVISQNSQVSQTPTPISRGYPEYPRRALDMRIEGYVIVNYDIDSDGRVENIRIVDAKPNNIFNRSVMHAMRQWRYQPIEAKNMTIKIVFNQQQKVNFDS